MPTDPKLEESSLNNEEEIKIKLVVDYLHKLGFDRSELSFEKNFILNVGLYTYRVDTEKQIKESQPRYDLLVTRNGENLCVIEVKSDAVGLGQDEIDQVVSYARLVHPIAPISIVTNGREFRIIDTVTKEEIPEEQLPDINGYRATLPDEKYYEALKHFLGYSVDNLLSFCKWQVNAYMISLKGSQEDKTKKYIPELFEPSERLTKVFTDFLQSDFLCFVMVGDSGSGKTCWICHSALEYITSGHPVLFYRAVEMDKNIFSSVSSDLNWNLSPQLGEAEGVKRFLDIFENREVVIFIDGLDEVEAERVRNFINDFLRKVEGRNVKLVATCKTEAWNKLLEHDGIPTILSEKVFRVEDKCGFRLAGLEESQFYRMINRYQKFYAYKGGFEDQVLNDCKRSPFLLRIVFEVGSDKGLPHLSYSTLDFYEKYFELMINRIDELESGEAIIIGIATSLFRHNVDSLDINEIRRELGLSVVQQIPERLFELNILERNKRGHTTYIGFYYKKFRDFLIAFRALKWQKWSPEEFGAEAQSLEKSGIHRDVLHLYYMSASEEHKRALDRPFFDKANRYVQIYQDFLDTDFLAFKESFRPHTGNIGFVGYLNLSEMRVLSFGFRAVKEDDEKVIFLPETRGFDVGNLAFLYGVEYLHLTSSSDGFRDIDLLADVIWEEIKPELDKITKNGLLNESHSRELLCERIVAVCVRHYNDQLGIQNRRYISQYLPLNLKKVKEVILYSRALRVLEANLIQGKIDSEDIKPRWEGSRVSYSFHLTETEKEELHKEASKVAKEEEFIPSDVYYVQFDDM